MSHHRNVFIRQHFDDCETACRHYRIRPVLQRRQGAAKDIIVCRVIRDRQCRGQEMMWCALAHKLHIGGAAYKHVDPGLRRRRRLLDGVRGRLRQFACTFAGPYVGGGQVAARRLRIPGVNRLGICFHLRNSSRNSGLFIPRRSVRLQAGVRT